MKNAPVDRPVVLAGDAVPTLKRAVRKARRPRAALRPVDPAGSGFEARLSDAVQAVIQEEVQRMTRRVYARLPGVIAKAAVAGDV
ncbi:MAG: hypothetical protein EBR18_07810 [Betaproteobacteria bacterium]|jgi:hypothetical protein|nr:hypothetical protein [Betaproteobacteria bacterium]